MTINPELAMNIAAMGNDEVVEVDIGVEVLTTSRSEASEDKGFIVNPVATEGEKAVEASIGVPTMSRSEDEVFIANPALMEEEEALSNLPADPNPPEDLNPSVYEPNPHTATKASEPNPSTTASEVIFGF